MLGLSGEVYTYSQFVISSLLQISILIAFVTVAVKASIGVPAGTNARTSPTLPYSGLKL